MSSSFDREPLTGVIRCQDKIVGGIALPTTDTQQFIDEFNHCYGPLNLHIDPPAFIPAVVRSLYPVGAYRNLRAPHHRPDDRSATPRRDEDGEERSSTDDG
ncbi:MAG: hypothetical protein KatS3mg111_3315 [Pirellulaceae bacterium]|nr:MAG: hypothetical protein KatS3mg111_3315 [Pirellulaceae bacterium]